MRIETKTAAGRIDPVTETDYNFIQDIDHAVLMPHTHDFFEIFLITNGSVIHVANNTSQLLTKGFLVFIRPEDIHYYRKYSDHNVQFINLAFPKKTLYEMFQYLGDGFSINTLLKPKICPIVVLPEEQTTVIKEKIKILGKMPKQDKHKIKASLRILLIELIINHFYFNIAHNTNTIPNWLTQLNNEMHKKCNFESGIKAMRKISGKSTAYLCRVYKKYFNLTPVQYLNKIKLHYAAGLLTSTDKNILDIAMEVGFVNLSYFYDIFKKRYLITPAKYRKLYYNSIDKY